MENTRPTDVTRQQETNSASQGNTDNNLSGGVYGQEDSEMIRQRALAEVEKKKRILDYEDLGEYEMPPRSQFSMLNKPAVSIKYGKLTFNMACIRLFEGIQYVLPLVHMKKKKLTLVMCPEEESAAVGWARIRKKDGKWTNKEISSLEFVHNLYELMGWKPECRYKVLGHVANSREGLVLVFELEEAVMFAAKPAEFVDQETGEVKKKQIKFYPDRYKGTIGRSYDDYVSCRQINMFEYLDEYVGKTYSDIEDSSKKEDREKEVVQENAPGVKPDSSRNPVSGDETEILQAEPIRAINSYPDSESS